MYGSYYGYPSYSGRPLPGAGWTCPECGEHRSETSRSAPEVIANWRRHHVRDHEIEKMPAEEAEQAREEDARRATEEWNREMSYMRAMSRTLIADDPPPKRKINWIYWLLLALSVAVLAVGIVFRVYPASFIGGFGIGSLIVLRDRRTRA
jgi:hypothetical protein